MRYNEPFMSLNPVKSVRRLEVDGLRAMAAIWVMCDHFGLSQRVGMHYGFLAVRLMLILSAYFAARQLKLLWVGGLNGPSPAPGVLTSKLVHYYTSRVVRLGLVSYGTILVAVALNIDGARGTWQWHAAFATNEWIARYGDWPGSLSHFWSLAVQMQFLLLLPLAMILVCRGGFWPALIAGFIAAIGHRACVVYGGAGDFLRWMPISNSLDAFCLGVALAWVEGERPRLFERIKSPAVCGSALACLVAVHWLRGHAYDSPLGIFTETGESIALVLLFGAILGGRTFGPVGAFLRWKPLVKMGAASLSLYALHPIVERIMVRVFLPGSTAQNSVETGLGFQLILVAAALGVAWGAYLLVEVPAGRISAALEPPLGRWVTKIGVGIRHLATPSPSWSLRPVGIVMVFLVLFYTATSSLRVSAPLLEKNGAQPIANENVDDAQDAPVLFFPMEQEPVWLDDDVSGNAA